MNALHGMDRYQEEMIQVSTYKECNKRSVYFCNFLLYSVSTWKRYISLVDLETYVDLITWLCNTNNTPLV